jgi:ABC-type polysaccharide/polyol phosphate transport system ATPase subunit
VLAVGDIAFQQKSHEKMKSVAKTGRTVVLVSHAMQPIRELCDRVIWMHGGKFAMIGTPDEVVAAYETAGYASNQPSTIVST